MTTSQSLSGSAGAVVDTTVIPSAEEDILTVLDTVEDPSPQPSEESDAQPDVPYSYLFWKTVMAKFANAETRLDK